MAKPICSVEACERPSKHCGLCGMHYQRAKSPTAQMAFGRHKPLHQRLWTRVEVHGGDSCWLFQGPRYQSGYGKIGVGGRGGGVMPASRAAWLVTYGPIPDGLHICHKCDNPPCCRPDHLFVGTRSENMLDAARKNRTRGGKLTWEQRQEIIATFEAGLATQGHLAEVCEVSQSAVSNMIYDHRRRSQSANNAGS